MFSLSRTLPLAAVAFVLACDGTTVSVKTVAPHDPALARSPSSPPADPAIAYFNRDELWVMNDDGSNRTKLAPAPGNPLNGSWSPDGKSFAYRNNNVITRIDVGVVDGQVVGGSPMALRPAAKLWHVAWSPAVEGSRSHNKIAYTTGTSTASTHASIILIPADRPSTSAEDDTVFAGPLNHHVWEMAWNPSGTKIAFILAPAYPIDADYVVVYDLATSTLDTIAQFVKGTRGISWARTQDKLAFTAPLANGNTCCSYVMHTADLATKTLTKLVNGLHPVWSPTDDKLVFDKPSGPVSTYTFSSGATTALAQGTKADWRR